jgi:hypothetical protein
MNIFIRKILDFVKRNPIILYIIIMLILDLIILTQARFGDAKNLEGQLVDSNGVYKAAKKTLFFGIPTIGIFLGCIGGLIPNKGLHYEIRWFKSSLWVILISYLIIFILGLRNLLIF